MLKMSRLAALLLTGALVSAPALAAKSAGNTAFKVNGKAVPQQVYDAFFNEQKAQGAPDGPDLQKAVKEELIRRELLTQEAVKQGLEKKPEIAGQVALARQAVLIRAAVTAFLQAHPVADAQLQQDYDAIKSKLGSQEFKAAHVLVETEQQAKDIIAKLDKGEKIADLAKMSKDPGSKDNGGDLGWSSPNAYVKPFAEALSLLKKGEYTKTPVKTDFGYHVILLEDSRPLTPPPFEQVKPQLQQRAQQKLLEMYVRDLREKAKVQ